MKALPPLLRSKKLFSFFKFLLRDRVGQVEFNNFCCQAHVSGVPDRTIRRMTMPFVSGDRYGPKDVFGYLNHVMEPRRNFFHTTRRRFYKN